MSVPLGQATAVTPLRPADSDVQSDIPFARKSCTFQYCPHPEACTGYCEHPYGRGPAMTNDIPADQVDSALDQIINKSMGQLSIPKVIDYKVCQGDTPGLLRMQVLAAQVEGYVLQGGVSVSYHVYNPSPDRLPVDVYVWAQAMVLYEDIAPLEPSQVPFIPFTE